MIQDYGFRLYNPAIGKFLSVDPLAPEFPWYTPYQFAGNKPIVAIDLDGLEEYLVYNYYDSEGKHIKTLINIVRSRDAILNMEGVVNHKGVKVKVQRKIIRFNVSAKGTTTFQDASDNLSSDEQAIINGGVDQSQTFYGDPVRESMLFGSTSQNGYSSETTDKGTFVFPGSKAPSGDYYKAEGFEGTYTYEPIYQTVRANTTPVPLSFINPTGGPSPKASWINGGAVQTIDQAVGIIMNQVNQARQNGLDVTEITIAIGVGNLNAGGRVSGTFRPTPQQLQQLQRQQNTLIQNTIQALGNATNLPIRTKNVNKAQPPSVNITATRQRNVGERKILNTK